jgi:type II secretory pathway component PulF
VAIFAMVLVVISFVREFLHFFQDRDVELTQATVTILKIGHAFTNYWYLLVLALPLEGVVYFLLRRTSGKFNWLATVVLVLPLMLVILSLVITMFGLFHPFVELVNADMAAGEV